MKAVVVLSALFATAIAASSPDAVARSLARRKAARTLRSQHSKSRIHARDSEYDENWAGAILPGNNITAASGSFPVLKAAVPTEKEAGLREYTASAWVGLDGYYCDNLWQAGVDSIVESTGKTSFYAWYEWLPAETQVVDLGEISTGDVINVELTAASPTEASVILENKTSGKKFTKTVTSPTALCGTAAVWILEDINYSDPDTGLANFSSVTFSNIQATVDGSNTSSISDAITADIRNNDNVTLTSTKICGSDVVVTYG